MLTNVSAWGTKESLSDNITHYPKCGPSKLFNLQSFELVLIFSFVLFTLFYLLVRRASVFLCFDHADNRHPAYTWCSKPPNAMCCHLVITATTIYVLSSETIYSFIFKTSVIIVQGKKKAFQAIQNMPGTVVQMATTVFHYTIEVWLMYFAPAPNSLHLSAFQTVLIWQNWSGVLSPCGITCQNAPLEIFPLNNSLQYCP